MSEIGSRVLQLIKQALEQLSAAQPGSATGAIRLTPNTHPFHRAIEHLEPVAEDMALPGDRLDALQCALQHLTGCEGPQATEARRLINEALALLQSGGREPDDAALLDPTTYPDEIFLARAALATVVQRNPGLQPLVEKVASCLPAAEGDPQPDLAVVLSPLRAALVTAHLLADGRNFDPGMPAVYEYLHRAWRKIGRLIE
jgi:hypothetical protein